MRIRRPAVALVGLGLLFVVALGAGTVLGVGPLAPSPEPWEVSDPDEMLARSLQAVLDASSVHVTAIASGQVTGRLVSDTAAPVRLDGTRITLDARPKDGRTRAHLEGGPFDPALDALTVWDGAYWRHAGDPTWTKQSLGAASAGAGVDINPLTLVDRLRTHLATPGADATVVDVACAAPSGRCREVRLDVGSDPATILGLAVRPGSEGVAADVSIVVTVQADVLTLRPARVTVEGASPDRVTDFRVVLDATGWDSDITIDEPRADEITPG